MLQASRSAVSALLAVASLSLLMPSGCARTQPVVVDSLVFNASTRWHAERPSHPSRRLEFSVPSQSGGVPDAEVVVWSFRPMRDAGDGRVIHSTLDQLCTQMVLDDGTPAAGATTYTEYLVGGMPVHTIDARGRFVGDIDAGRMLHHDRPRCRMLAAYIVAPHGDYLVRMIGPDRVVSAHAGDFRTFVQTVQTIDATGPLPPPSYQEPRDAQLTAIRE